MSCERVSPGLVAFHFGALDPEARRETEAHLVACRSCLDEFLALKRAVETADEQVAPSPASRARLRRAVSDELRRASRPAAWSWWERPLALGLAAASVWLALGAVHAVATGPGARPRGLDRGAAEAP